MKWSTGCGWPDPRPLVSPGPADCARLTGVGEKAGENAVRMRRGWAVAAAVTAGLVLAGCGSGSSGESGAVPRADRAAIDAMVDAALDGGDPVECRFEDEDDTGTYIIGPGRTLRANLDTDVALWLREGEYLIWDRRDDSGIRFGPDLVMQRGMVDLSGVDAVRQDGTLGPCRPFHGDRSDRRPPLGVDLTDIDRHGDLFVWLVDAYDDERASALFDVLFPASRAPLAAPFYLYLGMLLDQPEETVWAYGETYYLSEARLEQDLAALTEAERREFLHEALGRLRPEHRRAVEEALAD